MKLNYAACIIILLSFTYLHADEGEDRIIGTWLIRDNEPCNKYITYHPPSRRITRPIKFNITDLGECSTEDLLVGRYDSVMEVPGSNRKVKVGSGVWFFPKDADGKLILDIHYEDVDVDNYINSDTFVCPNHGISVTRIIAVDGNEFVYEEYNPAKQAFDRNRALKVPMLTLEQIKRLPRFNERCFDEL